MPHMADVEAFLANKPVLVVLVNVVKSVEEPLRALDGPIPSMLNHPLGLNIHHILDDLDMESKESVGMADDNIRPSTAAAVRTPQKFLSPIPKTWAFSRAPTPKRPRSPTPTGFDGASRSKRPRASKAHKASDASDSESTVEIRPEGANWTIGGKLTKLEGI
jgi:hypothetical protein